MLVTVINSVINACINPLQAFGNVWQTIHHPLPDVVTVSGQCRVLPAPQQHQTAHDPQIDIAISLERFRDGTACDLVARRAAKPASISSSTARIVSVISLPPRF